MMADRPSSRVMRRAGMPPQVASRLKAAGGYSHPFPHGDRRNPVVYVHRIEEAAGKTWHGCATECMTFSTVAVGADGSQTLHIQLFCFDIAGSMGRRYLWCGSLLSSGAVGRVG